MVMLYIVIMRIGKMLHVNAEIAGTLAAWKRMKIVQATNLT